MSEFQKQLSILSRRIAVTIQANGAPNIHCSKINSFITILKTIAPLLGTSPKKLTWATKGAMNSINDVLTQFRQIHSQCVGDSSYQFALSQSVHDVYLDFVGMTKELKKALDSLGIESQGAFDDCLSNLESQEKVDGKRIAIIISQLREQRMAKSRKDVKRHILQRTKSLEQLGITLQNNTSDIITVPELPQSLNFVLKHEDFETGKQIGSGISGRVFKGTVKATGEVVAIKILHLRQLSGADLEMFRREIFAMATLSHPSLLKFLGYTAEAPYCVLTQFMENGSLFSILANRPEFLNPTDRTLIAFDVARGMEFLHSRGVIHRDLKSLNILVDESKRGKISDFGFVRNKSSVPMTGLIGTAHWMAPEILLSSPNYDEKVDVYSYGILVWELLTSQQPYKNIDPMTLPVMVTQNNLRPTIPDNAPPKIKSLIERCWSTDPEQRPSFTKIISMFSDPEYHFPGSERFVLLRETGTMGAHSYSMTEPDMNVRKRGSNKSQNISSSNPLMVSDFENVTECVRVTMENGQIELFRNALEKFRVTVKSNETDWQSILPLFVKIINQSPSMFKLQLLKILFEICTDRKAAEALPNSTFVPLLTGSDDSSIDTILMLLSRNLTAGMVSDDFLNVIINFWRCPILRRRMLALEVCLKVGEIAAPALAKKIDKFIMFGARKMFPGIVIKFLILICSLVKVAPTIDQRVIEKLTMLEAYSEGDNRALCHEAIFSVREKLGADVRQLIDIAVQEFDSYGFFFEKFRNSFDSENADYLIEKLIEVSQSNEKVANLLSDLCSDPGYQKEVFKRLPIGLSGKALGAIYGSMIVLIGSDQQRVLALPEFYEAVNYILDTPKAVVACALLRSELCQPNLARSAGLFEKIVAIVDDNNDPVLLAQMLSAVFAFMRRGFHEDFLPMTRRLSELLARGDATVAPIAFSCLVFLAKFTRDGIDIAQVRRAAEVFARTQKGSVQALASFVLSQY